MHEITFLCCGCLIHQFEHLLLAILCLTSLRAKTQSKLSPVCQWPPRLSVGCQCVGLRSLPILLHVLYPAYGTHPERAIKLGFVLCGFFLSVGAPCRLCLRKPARPLWQLFHLHSHLPKRIVRHATSLDNIDDGGDRDLTMWRSLSAAASAHNWSAKALVKSNQNANVSPLMSRLLFNLL